jgi:hypothetical protein
MKYSKKYKKNQRIKKNKTKKRAKCVQFKKIKQTRQFKSSKTKKNKKQQGGSASIAGIMVPLSLISLLNGYLYYASPKENSVVAEKVTSNYANKKNIKHEINQKKRIKGLIIILLEKDILNDFIELMKNVNTSSIDLNESLNIIRKIPPFTKINEKITDAIKKDIIKELEDKKDKKKIEKFYENIIKELSDTNKENELNKMVVFIDNIQTLLAIISNKTTNISKKICSKEIKSEIKDITTQKVIITQKVINYINFLCETDINTLIKAKDFYKTHIDMEQYILEANDNYDLAEKNKDKKDN